MLEKIIDGKLGSYYKQMVLTDQESIFTERDPKMTVKDVLARASKTLGAPLSVTRFARVKVGEVNP